MAACVECGQEMLVAKSCTVEQTVVDDKSIKRIPFGSERPSWRMERCGDCGVVVGGYHHPGCDIEQCPSCRGQAIMCGCTDIPEGTDEDPVDVTAAIEIVADTVKENPERDHIDIIPVAGCGHVGRARIRTVDRTRELPLEEWFDQGRWLGDGTAAILFIVRTEDLERVTESDLSLARSIADYAAAHNEPPWELVFVTRQGNFKASELLRLPGLPVFEPCTYSIRSPSP